MVTIVRVSSEERDETELFHRLAAVAESVFRPFRVSKMGDLSFAVLNDAEAIVMTVTPRRDLIRLEIADYYYKAYEFANQYEAMAGREVTLKKYY